MPPDPVIGRKDFVDGITRDVYRDRATGKQYVTGYEGEKVFGVWVWPDPDDPDEPDEPQVANTGGKL